MDKNKPAERPGSAEFSEQDRRALEGHKKALEQRLRRDNHCVNYRRIGQDLLIIQANRLYAIDNYDNIEDWFHGTFHSQRQARKYIKIAERYKEEELRGLFLPFEVLCQLAMAPQSLYPALFKLAVQEHLPARSLGKARSTYKKALKARASIPEAIELAVAEARRDAGRGADGSRLVQPDLLFVLRTATTTLGRVGKRFDAIGRRVDYGEALPLEEVRAAALVATALKDRCDQLLRRSMPPGDPGGGTTERRQTEREEEAQTEASQVLASDPPKPEKEVTLPFSDPGPAPEKEVTLPFSGPRIEVATPAQAARLVGFRTEAEERLIDELCRDYSPQPLRPMPLCIPPPSGFRLDPGFRLAPAPLLLGAQRPSPQWGLLGRHSTHRYRVGLDLNESFFLSAFSLPRGGKSYLLRVILEMAIRSLPPLNVLPNPLCSLLFHYHCSDTYEPEILAAGLPNHEPRQVLDLMEHFGCLPEGLAEHIVHLCPLSRVPEMRRRYPHLKTFPLLLASKEMRADGLKGMLELHDERRLYARTILHHMGQQAGDISLEWLYHFARSGPVDAGIRRKLGDRLDFLKPLVCDRWPIRRHRGAGKLIVVDVRDEWMSREQAAALFTLLCSTMTQRDPEADYHLLLAFDELQELREFKPLMQELERLARQRRHLYLNLLLACQDPTRLPLSLLSLSNLTALGTLSSEEVVKYLPRLQAVFRALRAGFLSKMGNGRMLLHSQDRHLHDLDPGQAMELTLLDVRPSVSQHGGETHRAVR